MFTMLQYTVVYMHLNGSADKTLAFFIRFLSLIFLFVVKGINDEPVPYREGGPALCGVVCSVLMGAWVV